MAIITKPSITKGTPATLTLNKQDLLAHSSVSSDSYFVQTQNWNKVKLVYLSVNGKQSKIVQFDATQSSPSAVISFSLKARDEFRIQKLILIDFDNGVLEIPRTSLITADFDISFLAPAVTYITWDVLSSGYTTLSNGGIEKLSYNTGNDLSKSSSALTGDFELKYTFNYSDTSYNFFTIGLCNSAVIPNDQSGAMNVMLLANVNGSWGLYSQGSPVSVSSSVFNQSGQNIVSFKRIGSSLQTIINGVIQHTQTITSGNVYPSVRLAGKVISTSI